MPSNYFGKLQNNLEKKYSHVHLVILNRQKLSIQVLTVFLDAIKIFSLNLFVII